MVTKTDIDLLKEIITKLKVLSETNGAISDLDKSTLKELFLEDQTYCKEVTAQISMFNLLEL